jgi:NADPH-dependent 2,4-dienoyl-CoA reductase/sulfur reductase-like enzyme
VTNGKVELELAGAAQRPTTIETDHVICATGYRTDVDRLTFFDADLRAGLKTIGRAPVLNRRFESSVPNVYFAGIAAAVSFGPLMRFMYGDEFAAQRISSHFARSAV